MTDLSEEILAFLVCCRRDAGEPMMGCREVELAARFRPLPIWKRLTMLRSQGKVQRSAGWVWITEQEYERRTADI